MVNFSTFSIYKFITNTIIAKYYGRPCINLGSGHGEIEKRFDVDLSIDLYDDYAKRYNPYKKHDLNKKLDFIDEASYSLVMCFGTIHFLNSPETLISESNRILKKDGVFVINITNSFITNLWAKINLLPIRRTDLSDPKLEKLLKYSGFNIEKSLKLGIKTYYICRVS